MRSTVVRSVQSSLERAEAFACAADGQRYAPYAGCFYPLVAMLTHGASRNSNPNGEDFVGEEVLFKS